MFQYTFHVAILGATALISAFTAFAAWQRRSAPAKSSFVCLMAAVTSYAMVAALEAAAIALPHKIFWSKLEYVCSGCLITFFVFFARCFTCQKERLPPRQTALLWSLPVFNAGLVATNEGHHLIWTGFLPGAIGSNEIIYQHGAGFFWVMACVYAYTLTGTFLLARSALKFSTLYRQQSAALFVGSMAPMVGSILYMLNLTPPGLNIAPMSFMVTGLALSTGLLRFRMFDLIPIACDLLVENMRDGVLVLDVQNRLVEINPAAQHLLNVRACVGKDATEILANWTDYLLCQITEDLRIEIVLDRQPPCYVDLRISPLHDRRGRLTGRLVTLRDITHRYQIETELRQANDRLQSQLLEIKSLHAKLKEQALRDQLTGLFNRHHLEEMLPKELARAKRDSHPVAIVLLDIDFFKQVNDTFGHPAGDQMLREFGQLLSRWFRVGDFVYRFGGEEFVLVLPNVSSNFAYDRIEQIRRAFQEMRVKWESAEFSTTISGGIAVFPDDGATPEELLQAADRALYAAKTAGRNCVQVFQRLFKEDN